MGWCPHSSTAGYTPLLYYATSSSTRFQAIRFKSAVQQIWRIGSTVIDCSPNRRWRRWTGTTLGSCWAQWRCPRCARAPSLRVRCLWSRGTPGCRASVAPKGTLLCRSSRELWSTLSSRRYLWHCRLQRSLLAYTRNLTFLGVRLQCHLCITAHVPCYSRVLFIINRPLLDILHYRSLHRPSSLPHYRQSILVLRSSRHFGHPTRLSVRRLRSKPFILCSSSYAWWVLQQMWPAHATSSCCSIVNSSKIQCSFNNFPFPALRRMADRSREGITEVVLPRLWWVLASRGSQRGSRAGRAGR